MMIILCDNMIIILITLQYFIVIFRIAWGIIARSSGLFENTKRICACDGVSIWDERNVPIAGPGRQQAPASQL